MNPLEEFPEVRKWVYRVYWLTIVIVGACQIGWVTATGETPVWILVALAILAYIGGITNFQADRNTSTSPPGE